MKTVSAVVAALAALAGEAGEVRLRGPEGARLDACIERNVAKTDPLYLAECFFRRNESHLWQSEFWGKYMHSAVPYWRYTKDAALKAKIDAGVEAVLAAQDRRFYGTGVRAFWRNREHELLTNYPKALAESVAGNDASAVTGFAKREQSRAFKDALRLFDELMWYIIENNRIEGDGSGATTLPEKAFHPKGLGE